MKNNYQLFKDWETEKSHLLAEGLKIKAEEHIAIEKCFDFLLESHKDFNTFDDQMNELPHADEKRDILEASLQDMFNHLPPLSQVAEVYILAKTLFYYNIVQTNFLKGTYVETIFALPLAKMYAQKSSTPIDVTQILLITDYLRESLRVGHNGKLLEDLLELIKDKALQKVWTRKQEAHLLQNLLYIHQKTDYCSNLKTLREVCKYVQKETAPSFLQTISNYKHQCRQGGMQMVEIILHTAFSKDIYLNFQLKNEFLILLDGLTGKNPKPTWIKKWKNIQERIDNKVLENVISQIEALKHYKIRHLTEEGKEITYAISDDVATSILKGVQWIREDLSGTLIAKTSKTKEETPEMMQKKIKQELEELLLQKTQGNIDLKTYLLNKKELEKMLVNVSLI